MVVLAKVPPLAEAAHRFDTVLEVDRDFGGLHRLVVEQARLSIRHDHLPVPAAVLHSLAFLLPSPVEVVKVRDGEVAISHQHGKLRILKPGRSMALKSVIKLNRGMQAHLDGIVAQEDSESA